MYFFSLECRKLFLKPILHGLTCNEIFDFLDYHVFPVWGVTLQGVFFFNGDASYPAPMCGKLSTARQVPYFQKRSLPFIRFPNFRIFLFFFVGGCIHCSEFVVGICRAQ